MVWWSKMNTDQKIIRTDWNKRFLSLAEHIASWSKDPSTKVGAVAVNFDTKQILSVGYNGFPRGIADEQGRLDDRPTKYKYVVHAEQNCIYNATQNGISLRGATMFVTPIPTCSECAKALIQTGVKKVVMPHINPTSSWAASSMLAKELYLESGLTCMEVTYDLYI